ncbi:MAG: hypothetical protein WKF30_02655 [Pyrinomonadaceae bacterium]
MKAHKMFITAAFTTLLFLNVGTIKADGQLLIKANEGACKLSIDGSEVATIKADGVYKATVGRGEHLLEAVSLSGYFKWAQTVEVTSDDQKVIHISKMNLAVEEDVAVKAAFEGKIFAKVETYSYNRAYLLFSNCEMADPSVPYAEQVKFVNPKIFRVCKKPHDGPLVVIEFRGANYYIPLRQLKFHEN